MSNEKHAYFLAGQRTAFGLAGKGMWKDHRPDDLMVSLLCAHKAKYSQLWNVDVDDFILGCAYPEGEQGYNLGRNIALGSGMNSPAMTINRLCGSSLEAAVVASSYVRCGIGRHYFVGGVESMSRVPRRGHHFSESDSIKRSVPQTYVTMGETAENVAKRFSDIDRSAQEDFAARSHELAAYALSKNWYEDQLAPEMGKRDESIRYPVNREKMAALPAVFSANGVVTAATSSPMSDGATCGFIASSVTAAACQFSDGLRIVDSAVAHVEPELMGLGPIPAVRALLQRHQLTFKDIQAVEMNEAFSVQALACIRSLEMPMEIVNCWGGALAIGHPLGASGLRLLMTLSDRMRHMDRNGALGIACLCIGGGQGLAVLVEFNKFQA